MKSNRLFQLAIAALVMVSIPAAWSAEKEGNGGHGVVCRDSSGKIKSIEVLDLYEARILHGWPLSLGAPNLSYQDKIKRVLARLQRLSPQRALTYQSQANTFESEARFLSGVDLELIPDAANVAVPTGCKLEQIVNQQAPLVPGDPRYVINGDLWNALSSDQKAALVLHEIVYREMIGYGHIYSISARWLVGWMTSTVIDSFTMKDFVTTLQDLAVKFTDVDQYTLPLVDCGARSGDENSNPSRDCATPQDIAFKASMDFYPSGNIKTYWETYSSDLGVDYGVMSGSEMVRPLAVSPFVTVEFDDSEDGESRRKGWEMSDTSPSHLVNLVGKLDLTQKSPDLSIANIKSYTLDQDGHLKTVEGGKLFRHNFLIYGDEFDFKSGDQISIKNGKVDGTEDTQFAITADSLLLNLDFNSVSAQGHAVYKEFYAPQGQSDKSPIEIDADSILEKKDGSVLADQVEKVEGVTPKGYFSADFDGEVVHTFFGVGPASHFEWSQNGQWSSRDVAFNLPREFFSYWKTASGNRVAVRLEDVFDTGEDRTVKFSTIDEVEVDLEATVVYIAPGKPIVVSIGTIESATLSRNWTYRIRGVDATFEGGTPVDFFTSYGWDDTQVLSAAVLASDARLKTGNFFFPEKLVKAGTRVQFNLKGYLINP